MMIVFLTTFEISHQFNQVIEIFFSRLIYKFLIFFNWIYKHFFKVAEDLVSIVNNDKTYIKEYETLTLLEHNRKDTPTEPLQQ